MEFTLPIKKKKKLSFHYVSSDLDFLEVILEPAFKQIFDELHTFYLEASLVSGGIPEVRD